jgi:hypothetical protein
MRVCGYLKDIPFIHIIPKGNITNFVAYDAK